MEVTIPIYIEIRRDAGRPMHHLRALFFPDIKAADPQLGLAIGKLQKRIKERLDRLAELQRHEELANAIFSPNIRTQTGKLRLELRDRMVRCRLLFVVFPALERRVAFSPSLPDVWFELTDGENVTDRAEYVLSDYFNRIAKGQLHAVEHNAPESISLSGQAWVTTIGVDVRIGPVDEKKAERKFAALFDETRMNGGLELQSVGRCLDWLYPSELHRAIGREADVHELSRLLDNPDNRPIALIGPRLVGKTTVIHECVRARVERRTKAYGSKRNVWLLSPQRLISGMMYVGQWEGRVEAILKAAKRRKHILYFDDFLGLYRAGISRDSNLCVADMMRPYIQRRDVRVLAEMPIEAWQRFCERDRGLAEQFHVLRVSPMSLDETRHVLVSVQRELENDGGVQFDLTAIPANLRLHESYVRDAEFPGKAADFVRRLAHKYRDSGVIGRKQVYHEFHHKSGLSLNVLDERIRLTREEIIAQLRQKLVGRDEAIEAAADVITVTKARLNDVGRPLATLLFLGPTGVGKTQCAKAVAEVLYGDANRLVRFDMNEYGTPYAVTKLVGNLTEPDGLLVTSIRRNPFSVVLLDEIEKAHPDVFDLLLQVTGEGRLTDSVGRTADFTNTVVVMTSNLGTSESESSLGWATNESSRRQVFVKAAESFFRPEFFNRIDRVVPFSPLSRSQVREIATRLLDEVFRRDGLVRRRCALHVEDNALERIVDRGYHPQFGARALKRTLEQELIQPIAAQLSGVKPELPAVLRILSGKNKLILGVDPLDGVTPTNVDPIDPVDDDDKLKRVDQFIDRIKGQVELARPTAATAGSGESITAETVRYFTMKEQLHRVRQFREQLLEEQHLSRAAARRFAASPTSPSYDHRAYSVNVRKPFTKSGLKELNSSLDIHAFLREGATSSTGSNRVPDTFQEIRREAALLEVVLAGPPSGDGSYEVPQHDLPAISMERVSLAIHPLSVAARSLSKSLELLAEVFARELGFDCHIERNDNPDAVVVINLSGPGALCLAVMEAGVHVFCRRQENLLPVQISAFAVSESASALSHYLNRRSDWVRRLSEGETTYADNPWPLGNVVRFYDEEGPTFDVRSGRSLSKFPTSSEWKTLLLDGLPVPREFSDASFQS